MVSNNGFESEKARRRSSRLQKPRRKHLRKVTVTARLYYLLSKAVLVTLYKIVRLSDIRDVVALQKVPMLAADMSEELAAKEVSELLSYHVSGRLALEDLNPLVQIIVLVHNELTSLPRVSSGALPTGGTRGAGRALWTNISVGSLGSLRAWKSRKTRRPNGTRQTGQTRQTLRPCSTSRPTCPVLPVLSILSILSGGTR
jgi:hypothetical protein